MTNPDYTHKLQKLMRRANIASFQTLSCEAGVSRRQILRLREGNIHSMRVEVLLRLSKVLKVTLNEMITIFDLGFEPISVEKENIVDLKTEYQRSLLQLEQQRELLQQEFQQSSLQLLESLLLQWPTAAYKAQQNPQLPAVKILPLVQHPLEKLLQNWGVEAMNPVGATVAYNPQYHQLTAGTAQPGDNVKVSHVGYLKNGKLLHRAKVNLI